MTALSLGTPHGQARALIHEAEAPRGVVVLGHGAGGGIAARDLVEAKDVALAVGLSVALVEQPYRVAGRRSAPPAGHLDVAWMGVVDALRADWFHELPLVVGGRSSGARVACRTSAAAGAAGVLCLAFPLQPPQGSRPEPRPSRLTELDAVEHRRASRSRRERPLRDTGRGATSHGLHRAGRPQLASWPRHRGAGRQRMAAAGREV